MVWEEVTQSWGERSLPTQDIGKFEVQLIVLVFGDVSDVSDVSDGIGVGVRVADHGLWLWL